MKKCGIVTLWGDNFGNKVQNYALQEFLKKNYNFDVYTIVYRNEKNTSKVSLKNKIINKLNVYKNRIFYGKLLQERKSEFYKFSNKHIKRYPKQYSSQDNTGELNDIFDQFVVGSDQVWNTCWEGKNPFFYLNFASNDKKISYAASFGIDRVDPLHEEMIKNELSKFKYISVREEQGQKIIKELINKDVQEVVDPTLLLTRNEWEAFAKESKFCDLQQKYILTYFLGKDKHKQEMKLIEKKTGYKCINLIDLSQKEYYTANPIDFVCLIKNAEIIYTDSFHACVFSIIFNKKFVVLDRIALTSSSMNSRIKNLLKKFNLENCYSEKCEYNNIVEYSEKDIELVLNEERNKSKEFLNKAFYSNGGSNE